MEMKVLVGSLFCDLIPWIPYTGKGNSEIIRVATLLRSYHALGTAQLKIPQRYLDLFNRATFYKGVK